MKKIVLFGVLVVSMLIGGCASEEFDKTLLHGQWQADQFLESGKAKDIDVSKMAFTFNAQQVYTYSNNLKGGEAGNYRIENDLLYTTDTLNDQRVEKVVRITKITTDSLSIKMNSGGTEQVILLHKVK